MTEIQPPSFPLADLAHTDQYGIDGDVVGVRAGGAAG